MIKILVIEDEQPVLENILELLEIEGFEALGSDNGVSGVQLAQQAMPDLIICDVMMPELDGYGVISALRQNLQTGAIPFIFLTAKSAKEDMRQGMNLGADDYLTKPFTRADLLGAIEGRLKKEEVRQEVFSSALEKAEKNLYYVQNYDALTNLPNKRLLKQRLNHILRHEKLTCLMCIKLDRFNRINNSRGFDFGDLLLKDVAQRLQRCVKIPNTLARLNSAEFAIVLENLSSKEDAANFARNLLEVLSQPFVIEGYELFIAANIGMAFSPTDSCQPDTLLQQAESTMYAAKNQGENCYKLYAAEIEFASSDLLELETELRYALERNELEIYYQPQVDATGKITGSEALIRWNHPKRGLVSPATFIPLAEETGLIIPIGEWVLRTACQQTKYWHSSGFPSLQVAVNWSVYQFQQPNVSEKIYQILQEIGYKPELLELEITESMILENANEIKRIFREFKDLGIYISVDDFGTGYSSLGYLQQFPFDNLKIDRCFIKDIPDNPKTTAITIGIIQMAHRLNLKVTAEGVETQEQKNFLWEQKCDLIQGYLFSRPLPAAEFEKLLFSSFASC